MPVTNVMPGVLVTGISDRGHDAMEVDAEQLSADLSQRAASFLVRKLEEAKASIKEILNEHMLTYEAINRSRVSQDTTRNLKDGFVPAEQTGDTGSFLSSGDGRILLCQVDCNLKNKQVWSYTFDRSILKCMECGSHGEKPFLRSKGDKSGHMEVIVLADQSFPPPPCSPVRGI
jgi:hypothetical protein